MIELGNCPYIALDTETTGVSPYKGHVPFCVTLSTGTDDYYFTMSEFAQELPYINAYKGIVFMQNAKFDMAMLEKFGVKVENLNIHCTMSGGRINSFDEVSLSLVHLGRKLGYEKSDEVKKYMDKHKLYDWEQMPGKKKRTKNYYFDKVPREVIEPYAIKDSNITYKLGLYQIENIEKQGVTPLLKIENQLTKVLYRMERYGIAIDKQFVEKAFSKEEEQKEKLADDFLKATNILFKDSRTILENVFSKTSDTIHYTDKGNASFTDDILKKYSSPIAQIIRDYRTARVRASTYDGILYYLGEDGFCHPTAWQCGCATGRMSYSDPPIQCMEKVEKDSPDFGNEFLIRRSFVPRRTFVYFMMDFDQFEYRVMANYACEKNLIDEVKKGKDAHQATADIMGVTRKQAKTINFMLLYGGGVAKLATALGIDEVAAGVIRDQYFKALPNVKNFIRKCHKKIETDGFTTNLFGRKYYLEKYFSYKAPNYLIQGSCADWVKRAMINIDEYLCKNRLLSKMLIQVHDEILFEIHESELHILPTLQNFMQNVLPHRKDFLEYTVGLDYSTKSWQDKKEWTGKLE